MPLTTENTTFTHDVLGRYICNTLQEARDSITGGGRPFDFIIIGGGTFGAVLAEHLWFRTSNRNERILVLEAGPFLLPEHIQNLELLLGPGFPQLGNEVWGQPWNSPVAGGFPGLAYTLGGRSVFWGGWSPRPLDSELPKNLWPTAVLDDLLPKNLPDGRKGYIRQAGDQIGVTQTNDFIFGDLHSAMRRQLFNGLSTVTDAIDLAILPDHPAVEYRDTPATLDDLANLLGIDNLPSPPPSLQELRNEAKLEAPLAVQGQAGHAGFFPLNKFSAVPLLMKAAREAAIQSGLNDANKRLMVVPRCHVMSMRTYGGRVAEIVTEQGPLNVYEKAKVIIALGTVESTRLALLSFGGYGGVGRNLLAHLHSSVDIRVPRAALAMLPATAKALEASALFVKGQHQFKKPDGSLDGVGHFHLQISASGRGPSGTDSEAELFKKISDIDTFEAHKNATDTHVVITIRGIGEMEPKQDGDFGNSVTLDLNPQQNDEFETRRAYVNIQPSSRDWELWGAMDNAIDDVAKVFANGQKIDVINKFNGQVIATNVDASQLVTILPYTFFGRRWPLGMSFHEAGTLRFGDDPFKSVTDANCCFHQVSNAYVVGPSLFPTIGSPGPMLTGIALARRLGDHLMSLQL